MSHVTLAERAAGFVAGRTLILASASLWAAALGQFWGHKVEGKKPSFLKDLQFLLIGPLWLLHFVYRRLGWGY